MSRVLVVEDERKLLRALERGLRAEGYEVVTAADGAEGQTRALGEKFDLIILDWMLPGRDGLEILTALRQAGRMVPVMFACARVRLFPVVAAALLGLWGFAHVDSAVAAAVRHSPNVAGVSDSFAWVNTTKGPANDVFDYKIAQSKSHFCQDQPEEMTGESLVEHAARI